MKHLQHLAFKLYKQVIKLYKQVNRLIFFRIKFYKSLDTMALTLTETSTGIYCVNKVGFAPCLEI